MSKSIYLDSEFDVLVRNMQTAKNEIETVLTSEKSGGSCNIDSVDKFEECIETLKDVIDEYKELVDYDVRMIDEVLVTLRKTDERNKELTESFVAPQLGTLHC